MPPIDAGCMVVSVDHDLTATLGAKEQSENSVLWRLFGMITGIKMKSDIVNSRENTYSGEKLN